MSAFMRINSIAVVSIFGLLFVWTSNPLSKPDIVVSIIFKVTMDAPEFQLDIPSVVPYAI